MHELDVVGPDGTTLHAYDTEVGATTVVWHHGTPNIGPPPAPLLPLSAELGLRWVSYDRPGYGGSTARPDRPVASAAADVSAIADALGLERFAVLGHSGGGPHALACAALRPDRVFAAVSGAGLAPFTAAGLDWFAGMSPVGTGGLQAAARGRAAKEAYEASAEEADPGFGPRDWAALEGPWGWFGSVVGPALAGGPAPLIDDDLAFVRPWGFDPATIAAPVLLLHGGADTVVPVGHSQWLSRVIPASELVVHPDEGHISVLAAGAEDALRWITAQSGV